MKVLFFNRTYFAGGVEKELIDLVKGLDKDQFDITIMVRRPDGGLKEQFLELESEHIHLRTCFDYLTPGKKIWQKAKNALIIQMAEKCLRRFPRLYYRFAIKEKFDVEVAFMHNEALAIIASSSNKKSMKIAWVHTDLTKLTTWKEYFITRRRQKNYFLKYDSIVCVSQLVKDQLKKLLGIHENVSVIYNGIDIPHIKALANEPLPRLKDIDSKKCICAVGRLSWEKNFEMLIRAHARLINEGLAHDLWIVGEGPEREHLEKLIQELNAESTVTLFGYQKNPYPFIMASDFLAVSSIYEGMSLVTVEAFALGKPVVSSCPVTKELFGDYECGVLTESDEISLSMGLKRMIVDDDFRSSCSKAVLKCSEQFNKDVCMSKVENLLMR